MRGLRSSTQDMPSSGGSVQDAGRVCSKGQGLLDQGSAGQGMWKAPHPAVSGRGGQGRHRTGVSCHSREGFTGWTGDLHFL